MFNFSKSKIIISTIIIGLIGSLLHFVFEWSGNFPPIGIISAINESTWEHTKLAFIPMFIFWLILTFKTKQKKLNWQKPAVAGFWATLLSILLIPMLFYTVTEGLGIHSVKADIGIFFVAILLSQAIAAHIYNKTSPKKSTAVLAIIGLFALFIIYAIFTFNPPNMPIFISPL